ncbi:MAG TPA: putative 2OG-Fe(II) oxygenase [Hypericibacter adhaerens]|uniref:putative 2OG-Fe(II) oxygenase n=1 Tax=Hypericibacter adhaerens TaxID=2602016 RepID=UPI002BB12B74|nr:putative 2OG-Fe(II) oxygenase [Hypericibacter adhaerens]HWA41626.1 putative 2OG-Fe(II) oxygenase [Hypericibacter adhaerens]
METWPEGQRVRRQKSAELTLTRFADSEDHRPALMAAILRLAQGSRFARRYIRAFGGIKVDHVAEWEVPEADLVEARACEFYRRIHGVAGLRVLESWANIYRQGDYSMPHSHPGAAVSVVYFLDLGDPDPRDPISGQFAVFDPRVSACCRDQPDCLTNPFMPKLEAGTMILFPGWLVHGVNPYTGERPRITLTWNLAPA